MNEDLMKQLLKIEIVSLMKKGLSFADAAKKAGEKMEKEIKEAEFETYCSEHDC